MSANMATELLKMDDAKLAPLLRADPNGWTTLHSLALGGSAACVAALLKRGADPAQQLPDGRTALDLAKALNWTNVTQVLRLHGAA
jgi:ankyrin repeat protein